jgi:hypothetical protein
MNFVIKERPSTLIVFLLLWFLAGAVQGAFMPLSGEEAYYWLFSQHLQWGYLDHPPAVAFFAYLGSLFDSTEFGARLFSSLLSTATLALLYDLLGRKHLRLFIFMTRDTVTVPRLSDKKRYHLRFGLKVQDLPPTINSNRLTISTP